LSPKHPDFFNGREGSAVCRLLGCVIAAWAAPAASPLMVGQMSCGRPSATHRCRPHAPGGIHDPQLPINMPR
jgi:hypothetical protein